MKAASIQALARIPLLAQLGHRDRELLQSLLRISKHEARSVVYWEGESADSVLFVLSGYLKAGCVGVQGREVVLCVLGPGDIVGDISLLDGGERPATVTALEASELASVDRPSLLSLMESSPTIAKLLLQGMARRMRGLTRFCEALASRTVPARLAEALLGLAKKHGESSSGAEISIPMRLSQQDLGNMVGASRESVNKLIRVWAEQGILRHEGGRVTLTDAMTLRSFARV